jgi:phosphoenolpyruvate carboxykinase (GTP)
MLPFCAYNMASYWNHWLDIGRHVPDPPRIFRVNWFRRDQQGKFLWPGFGENLRVLNWIIDRVHGRGYGVESPMGYMPRHRDIHWEGLAFDPDTFYELMAVDGQASVKELRSHEELFDLFYDRLPKEFTHLRELIKSRIWRSPDVWEMAREKI